MEEDVLPLLLMGNETLSNYSGDFSGGNEGVFQISTNVTITVTVSYLMIFLFGLVGNILVILVIVRNKEMRNSTNYFILNLSVADLFVLIICMPSALLEFHAKDVWYLGEAMCKLVPYLENLSALASVLTILAISFERYYAICHPFQAQYNCTISRSLKVLTAVWLFAIIVSAPFILTTRLGKAVFTETGKTVYVCRTMATSISSRAFFTANIVFFFFIPMIMLAVLYANIISKLFTDSSHLLQTNASRNTGLRNRRQVVFMLVSIIILFITCMLPFRILTMYLMYTPMTRIKVEVGVYRMFYLILFARVMYYLNSACNFLVYNAHSTKFRCAFRAVLCRRGKIVAENNGGTYDRRMTLTSLYSSGATVTRRVPADHKYMADETGYEQCQDDEMIFLRDNDCGRSEDVIESNTVY
ncbi:QRFP-like peptide receptor [Tubulanus polymorphus]|uniref:QRFP-like peptide receptor n=1 Tax=Tubulanus polymorphus TaxID=672921 RepID=UPI003DA43081